MKFTLPSEFSKRLERLEEGGREAPDSQELAYAYRRLYEEYTKLQQELELIGRSVDRLYTTVLKKFSSETTFKDSEGETLSVDNLEKLHVKWESNKP